MAKQKERLEQWLPLPSIPDTECTLLQYWSRHHKGIAVSQNFEDPQGTIEKYTSVLKIIETALSNKKMITMTAYDIWTAVVSIRLKLRGKNAGEPYSESVMKSRLAVINDIYNYAESMAVCCNPIWLPPWKLIEGCNYDFSAEEIKNKLREKAAAQAKTLPRGLTKKQEQKLMCMIMEHITEDGRWVALLLMLLCGFRPSEVRGLTFGHLCSFKAHPSRRYILVVQTATSTGVFTDSMKNRQSVRAIPEHIELQALLTARSEFVKSQLSRSDISLLPIVCSGNDFEKSCTSTELAIFAKKKLRELFEDGKSLKTATLSLFENDLADETYDPVASTVTAEDRNADLEISARMLRRNYATKCYAETRMTDIQIRLTMGHKLDIDVPDAYSETNLWLILQNMDHRLIMPSLHPDWILEVAKAQRYEISDTSKLFMSIPREVLAEGIEINITTLASEIGDDIILELQRLLPEGSEIVIKEAHLLDAHRHVDRINTDFAHWSLPKWPEDNLSMASDTDNGEKEQ